MDEVEGVGPANVESWGSPIYSGSGLSYTVTAGLTAPRAYRFKVRAVSEHAQYHQLGEVLVSPFSAVSTFYASSLPAQITLNTVNGAHLETTQSSIKVTWIAPTLTAAELPTLAYRFYWDEGFRSSGDFVLLETIFAPSQTFYSVSGILRAGGAYKF